MESGHLPPLAGSSQRQKVQSSASESVQKVMGSAWHPGRGSGVSPAVCVCDVAVGEIDAGQSHESVLVSA